eukprot:TRINITY_DN3916_c0_g3_i1.p1 TRINITY_DN3916_c0_g3~~TRINITY_DN3916_c0_g3_i1.p1  ORF type:complete len:1122 (+),score=212.65 TRINITY_DN3916_c0_g3_i1:687-4052(+)
MISLIAVTYSCEIVNCSFSHNQVVSAEIVQGLIVSEPFFKMANCTFDSNYISGGLIEGGALFGGIGTHLSDVVIRNQTAVAVTIRGFAIFGQANSVSTIDRLMVEDCEATSSQIVLGAIYVSVGNVLILRDSQFVRNHGSAPTVSGVGVNFAQGSSGNITNCNFINSTVSGVSITGGVISSLSSQLNITNSQFVNTQAQGTIDVQGGVISATGANLVGCTFASTDAVASSIQGGVIFATEALNPCSQSAIAYTDQPLTVSNVQFVDNKAVGSALVTNYGIVVYISDSIRSGSVIATQFIGNQGQNVAAAVYNAGSGVAMSDCNVVRNRAASTTHTPILGGGVIIAGRNNTLANSYFSQNVASPPGTEFGSYCGAYCMQPNSGNVQFNNTVAGAASVLMAVGGSTDASVCGSVELPCGSLEAAVIASVPGGVISVTSGNYQISDVLVTGTNLSIMAYGDVTFSCGTTASFALLVSESILQFANIGWSQCGVPILVATGSNVTLDAVTATNCNGQLFTVTSSAMSLNDCSIVNSSGAVPVLSAVSSQVALFGFSMWNSSSNSADGVLVADTESTLVITNSVVQSLAVSSQSILQYGVVAVAGPITVTSTQFRNIEIVGAAPQSVCYGGAVSSQAALVIVNSQFIDVVTSCSEQVYGGAVYAAGLSSSVLVSSFSNCNAYAAAGLGIGGAVFAGAGFNTIAGVNLTFNAATMGGAVAIQSIISAEVAAKVENCLFYSNDAQQNGGALAVDNGAYVVVSNCTIENCRASSGAAIYAGSGASLTVDCSILRNSIARQSGGAIASSQSAVSLFNVQCVNNTAVSGNGGCVFVEDSTIVIPVVALTIAHCSASRGGGIALLLSSAEVNDTMFFSNTASTGGAISMATSNVLLFGCNLQANTALQSGGALWQDAIATAVLNSCVFTHNQLLHTERQLPGNGHAIYGAGQLEIIGCTFDEHSWIQSVASVIFFSNTATIEDTVFAHSGTQSALAGAIMINQGVVDIRDCSFYRSEGQLAVDILVFAGSVSINSTMFLAGSGGGACVTLLQSVAQLQNVSIAQYVQQGYNGAAISALSNSQVTASSCSFVANTALDGYGAAIYISASVAKITDSICSLNMAAIGGGAIAGV